MKKLIATALAVLMIGAIAGCGNRNIRYERYMGTAIIYTPDGKVIEGSVEKWLVLTNGSCQVKIDGTTYITHSSNVVLIKESGDE